jgi:gluconate 5-dehydrogenase
MFDLTGKIAVVSGASSGLGIQMATAFARQGANLVILARRFVRLEELANKLSGEYNVKVLPIRCDITSTEDINAAAERVEAEFGRVDILLNCAGAAKNNDVIKMTDEEWDFTIAADETSVFKMTRAFAKLMQKNHYGRIINIASMYGLVGNTQLYSTAYHASKGAVVNFTRAVAAELATEGITCNAICPGYFETELTKDVLATPDFQAFAKAHVPMQRYGKPGELDAAAVFLASDEARYVTGVILPVDGGFTCI